jgi:hypothetical protein
MPQETKARTDLEAVGEPAPDVMQAQPAQGLAVDASDEAQLRHAIELAFHYRGDVTIARRSGGQPIEGYLFDRDLRSELNRSVVRVIRTVGGRVTIPCDDIERLVFSGRDTAAGRSFETWLRKYVERKLSGEAASIESDLLEG